MSRILVVDDERLIREMLRASLEKEGFEVVEAPNGKVALEQQKKESADLSIVDLFMPEKEGLETIRELKQDYPSIKIIAITGYTGTGSDDLLKSAKVFGANRTFVKPYNIGEVLTVVKKLLKDE